MSDDLVKQLRMVTGFIRYETGDRVTATSCLSEEAADYIEELETKLVKAVQATRMLKAWCRRLPDPRYENTCRDILNMLTQPLAEIKGEIK